MKINENEEKKRNIVRKKGLEANGQEEWKVGRKNRKSRKKREKRRFKNFLKKGKRKIGKKYFFNF